MPQNQWCLEDGFAGGTVQPVVQVGAAYSAVVHLDNCFVRGGSGEGEFVNPEVTGAVGNDCRSSDWKDRFGKGLHVYAWFGQGFGG
jgi:hypothetical protein